MSFSPMARVNPQGAILTWLRDTPTLKGQGWTATEIAQEIGLSVARTRHELRTLRDIGYAATCDVQTPSGAEMWRAIR